MSWVLNVEAAPTQNIKTTASPSPTVSPTITPAPAPDSNLLTLSANRASASQVIELKKLDLSEELAREVSLETEVALKSRTGRSPTEEGGRDHQPIFSDEMQNSRKLLLKEQSASRRSRRFNPRPVRSNVKELG